ncbi:hypothetical protein OG474_28730 [Kribbella sp. NBC_01505]|uniref:hypothetical protein n=1 Tax=Kribbella sp. NBC_01505 TaxID=2903580 RepID=UPI00386B3313
MIRHLAAVATAAALIATAAPTAQAATTGPTTTCTNKIVLKLPDDSLPGSSQATTADPSGRYILGAANRPGSMHGWPVLWVDGEPRWLGLPNGSESSATSVVEGGFVQGSTYVDDGEQYWIYSIQSDSYQILKNTSDVRISYLTRMNKRHDITGVAWDKAFEHRIPFIWPAGGQPRLLPVPSQSDTQYVDDLSDQGRVIARVAASDTSDYTSYVWESWNQQPIKLSGVHQESVWARDIEGNWIGGGETDGEDVTGLLWNDQSSRIQQLEEGVIDLNTSIDAVTAGAFGPFGDYPSMIIRSDGAKITFPEGTLLQHIFERGSQYTAAGYSVATGETVPVVFAC